MSYASLNWHYSTLSTDVRQASLQQNLFEQELNFPGRILELLQIR